MEGSEDSWLVQVCLEVVQTCEARLMLVRVVVVMVQEERNCQIVVMADKWELVNGRRLHLLLPYPWVHLEVLQAGAP